MKASCTYDLIDQIRNHSFPALHTIQIKMTTAAKGKVGMNVLALEPCKETPKGK